MASPLESTNSSECYKPFASVTGKTFTSPDPRINLRQWNKHAEEYATRTGERVSDGIRRAVYMNKTAQQDMRLHLMLNQSRLSIAEEVAQEIEDYQDATKEFSRDDKGQALQLVKTLCKVGNLVECHTTLERVGRRAKENGLGFQPERGEQRRFGGYFNWCWRIGHKESPVLL